MGDIIRRYTRVVDLSNENDSVMYLSYPIETGIFGNRKPGHDEAMTFAQEYVKQRKCAWTTEIITEEQWKEACAFGYADCYVFVLGQWVKVDDTELH